MTKAYLEASEVERLESAATKLKFTMDIYHPSE